MSTRQRFAVLVALVGISGFSQGMLLPLISVLLESEGISSTLNGLHATALYIGILIISPFLEPPLRKYGYKPMILAGGALVFSSIFFFTIWESIWFWFILRLLVGVGDNILHFGTQTWITTTTPEFKRGRSIAIYGLSFGLGFTVGPLMTPLVEINPALPFIASSLLCVIVWSFMFWVKNELPESDGDVQVTTTNTTKRFQDAMKYAWIALLAPFTYGFLETTLHSNFPVYAMRLGHDVSTISYIIPFFAAGSIISQIPLGILSDRIGRPIVLKSVLLGGSITFIGATFIEQSVIGLIISFAIAGMLVGSLYSLGVSYMTDLLPNTLLPAGNILCGVMFSFGSIAGPLLGGGFIDYLPQFSFFYVIVLFIILIFILMTVHSFIARRPST
ncbi:MFS transporter [Alkalibacillus salilacus]|uniref:MFS family permease n=1 Tax=Alkalibacillus salilacus TaxID=284582 RepID=A0ABT9VFQ5_9BACI|nr:MFS transporter [Alkalibacillus salilacus]MDQ0159804.1 MFS family permease [Alkalibacillus salilacus]